MDIRVAPIEIFYSCSGSPADTSLLEQLERHLSALWYEGQITTWHRREVVAGGNWQRELDRHLNTASVILLLISSDFLDSKYQYGVELQRALERHEANEARVIPIALRPCHWVGAPFAHLQAIPRNGRAVTEWSNRDAAFTEIVREIQAALETVQRLSMSAPSAALPKIWQIPYSRNPVFTGREQLLDQLRSLLEVQQTATLSQPQTQAISGLGGVGKTQLAVEYAYRHRQDYQAVFWVSAETQEALLSGYAALARALNLPEQDEPEQAIAVEAVRRWLQTHAGWLLILDNADDLTPVQPLLPSAADGHVILTTRAQATGRFAHRVEVATLPRDEGALLLLRRTGVLAAQEALEQAAEQEVVLARQISEELGDLPLALDQAGAYIEETGCGLAGYRRLYETRRAELLASRGPLSDDHPDPVATTWSLSFEKVEQRDPAAAELLRLCAYLAPDAIPEELLTQGARALGEVLAPVAADAYLLDRAIAALRAYSLLDRDPHARTLSVHRLVQVVMRERLPQGGQADWIQRTVDAVALASPGSDFANWPAFERLLPHALLCADWIERLPLATQEAALLLNQAAFYLHARGRYGEAEPLLVRALAICEQQLGAQHPTTATILNNLALLYNAQGKYGQAEQLLVRALTICEQQLGAQHSHTASSLNDLAGLYNAQGKYEQAEPLYERALAIREQQLGEQHPDTAQSLNNLATLYNAQRKYEQAEPLLIRALAIQEQQLGAQHPDTALSLNNLATLYKVQGKYEEAEPLLRRALEISEQQVGAQHPDTALSLNNLAALYFDQGKYEEAEPLLRRALEISEQQVGAQHPDTEVSLNNLAALYQAQGKYEQAEPLLVRALEIREQQVGA